VRQLANVMDLPLVLVGSIIVGGGIGYALDTRLHTFPILSLILGLLGFAGGMYELIRRLSLRRPTGKQDGQ
jgi:F0F1-type ATP synthase assembly protein I